MRVTIDGITYEGTPEEIRDIVENPPVHNDDNQHINRPDDRFNYPIYPLYPDPYQDPYPTYPYPSDITWTYYKKNWDGSSAVTSCADGYFLC